MIALRNGRKENAYTELLPIDVSHNAVHHHDGISVFDITDLSNIGCSFLFIRGENFEEAEEPDLTPQDMILSAARYIRYYKPKKLSEEQSSIISQCSALSRVSIAALKSRWPEVNWRTDLNDGNGSFTEIQPSQSPNLKEISIARLLEEGLQHDPANMAWLSHAQELQDFNALARSRLYDNPNLVSLPSGPDLLAHVIGDQQLLDLSPFTQLRPADIMHVLRKMNSDRQFERSLYLPDLKDISKEELSSIFSLLNLRELHLGVTGIPLDDLLPLAVKARLSTFTCPALYKRALDLRDTKNSFSVNYMKNRITSAKVPTLDFPDTDTTQFPITQIVYIRQCLFPDCPRTGDGGIRWSQLPFHFRINGIVDRAEEQPGILAFPVKDALVSCADLTGRLSMVLPRLLQTQDFALLSASVSLDAYMTNLAPHLSIDVSMTARKIATVTFIRQQA